MARVEDCDPNHIKAPRQPVAISAPVSWSWEGALDFIVNTSSQPGVGLSKRRQWVLLLCALLVFGFLLAVSLLYERRRVFEEQFARLSTQARVVDDNMVRQLEGVSNTLKSALRDAGAPASGDPDRPLFHLHLETLAEATLGVRTYAVLNGTGRILASSQDAMVGTEFPNWQHLITPMEKPDPKSLYLSPPFKTLGGAYAINLVRVSTGPDGRAERIAVATVDPDFFSVLLSSVRYDPDVWAALAHINGSLLLRYPERPDLIGSNLHQPGSFFTRHLQSGEAATELQGQAKATGLAGWMAQRTISAPALDMKGALVVAVARDPTRALATVRQMMAVGAGMWAVISCIAVLVLASFQRQQARADRLRLLADSLRRKAEEEVKRLAFYDPLTELPNRRMLFDRMKQLRAASVRQGSSCALLFLDLDGFKQLNDTLGHDHGDLLLREVAKRLQAQIRQEDTAARWGGDEFVVVLSGLSGDRALASARCETVAQKILLSLAQEYRLNGHPYHCTASMGVALFGLTDETADDILKRADEAMYVAKSSGKNLYRFSMPTEQAGRPAGQAQGWS